jgi:hypothetical protein
MEEIKLKIKKLKNQLMESKKEKFLCVSTTANINNPQIFIGSIRETATTIAGNIILRDTEIVDYLIEEYDGFVEYFMIDCESKNKIKDLESYILPKIKKSKILIYKPNDFAVESLDVLVSTLFISLRNINVFVVGAGNLGSKISIKLCERGANVFLFDKDNDKLIKIVEGLNLVKRSNTQITSVKEIKNLNTGLDIVIGCTQGIPAISLELVESMKDHGAIIDAGNGTILPDAINLAKEKNIEVLCLSSLPGYIGMIENWLLQRNFSNQKRFLSIGKYKTIIPGIFGSKGDIIVDRIVNPTKIIGMCDGKGDILKPDDTKAIFEDFFSEYGSDSYVLELRNLYDKM